MLFLWESTKKGRKNARFPRKYLSLFWCIFTRFKRNFPENILVVNIPFLTDFMENNVQAAMKKCYVRRLSCSVAMLIASVASGIVELLACFIKTRRPKAVTEGNLDQCFGSVACVACVA